MINFHEKPGPRNIIGNVIDLSELLEINKEIYHVSRVTE